MATKSVSAMSQYFAVISVAAAIALATWGTGKLVGTTKGSDSGDHRRSDRLLATAGLDEYCPSEHGLLVVMHKGIPCARCVNLISLLAAEQQSFRDLNIELVGICPELPQAQVLGPLRQALNINFPLLADPKLDQFRRFHCTDEQGQISHGLFLFSKHQVLVWSSITEHAVNDVDEILVQCHRHFSQ